MNDIEQRIQNHREDIKELYKHSQIANEEMGAIKIDIATVKSDINWIKEMVKKVDTRVWAVLGTVVLGVITQVLIAMTK